MLALQGDAVTIFDWCYGLVSEVRDLIETPNDVSEERYMALDHTGRIRLHLDNMRHESAFEMWRPIEQARVSIDMLRSEPFNSRFLTRRKNGISVSEMLEDVSAGLDVILDFLNEQTRRSNGESVRSLSARQSDWEAEVENEIKRAGNTIQVATRALGGRVMREIGNLPSAHSFVGRIDRAQYMQICLRFAGRDTRLEATDRMYSALEDICKEFPQFLNDEIDVELNSHVKGAREIVRYLRLMLRRHAGLEGYPGTPQAEQMLAPFQFTMVDERLVVQPQEAHPKSGSRAIAQAALTALAELAEDIKLELEDSNHPRLLRSFTRLLEAMERNGSVIEIGLHCSSFEGQVNAAAEEVSTTLNALLSSYADGVKSYASQFEDWQHFSANAMEDRYSREDAELFKNVARKLAADLENRQEVDELVSVALWQAADWNDRADTPRTRLGVGRTVLNVIAACFSELVVKPAYAVLGVGGTVVVVVVLHHALSFGIELSKTPEGAWLRPAMKVIEKKLSEYETQ